MINTEDLSYLERCPPKVLEEILQYLPAESALNLLHSSPILDVTFKSAILGPAGQKHWKKLYKKEYDDVWTNKLLSSFNGLPDEPVNEMSQLLKNKNWTNLHIISNLAIEQMRLDKLVESNLDEVEMEIKSDIFIDGPSIINSEVQPRFTLPFANSLINVLSQHKYPPPDHKTIPTCYVIYKNMSSTENKKFIISSLSVLEVKTFIISYSDTKEKPFRVPKTFEVIALISQTQLELIPLNSDDLKTTILTFPMGSPQVICEDMIPRMVVKGNILAIWANEINILIYKLEVANHGELKHVQLAHLSNYHYFTCDLIKFWNEMALTPQSWIPIVVMPNEESLQFDEIHLAFISPIEDSRIFCLEEGITEKNKIPEYPCEIICRDHHISLKSGADIRSTHAEGIYIVYNEEIISYSADSVVWHFNSFNDSAKTSLIAIISKNLIIRMENKIGTIDCAIMSLKLEERRKGHKWLKLETIRKFTMNTEVCDRIMLLQDVYFDFQYGIPYLLLYFLDMKNPQNPYAWKFKKITFELDQVSSEKKKVLRYR